VPVTDGTLGVGGPSGVRLERVQLAARAAERHGDGAWTVSARAGVGPDAEVVMDGVLTRDLRGLDVAARMQRVALGPWAALTGAPAAWDGRVSFDGRLRVAVNEDNAAAVTLAGEAVLANVAATGAGGFHADRIVVGIRHLQWPEASTVVDSIVMTRPAFALPAATPWPRLLVAGNVSVVDGELREAGEGRTLRDLDVKLVPTEAAGAARLRLTASIEGRQLGVDRIVPYEPSLQAGLPLPLLLAVLEDAARAVPEPVAVPAPTALPALSPLPAPASPAPPPPSASPASPAAAAPLMAPSLAP
jgi:hypothetical protein